MIEPFREVTLAVQKLRSATLVRIHHHADVGTFSIGCEFEFVGEGFDQIQTETRFVHEAGRILRIGQRLSIGWVKT